MAADPGPHPPTDPAGPHLVPPGTVYGRGGVPVGDGKDLSLFSRLHPAITAAVAASVIAVLTIGYLVWRSAITEESPTAARPTTGGPAFAGSTQTPDTSPGPSPSEPTAIELTPGTWSLELVDNPGRYVRRLDGFGAVEPIDPTSDTQARQDATLVVTNGLADASCFTFRTADGRYLRHYDFRLRFDPEDDSGLFREDATFCAETGAIDGSVRLRSHNYPDRVIHHRDSGLWLDQPDGSQAFRVGTSFAVRSPLASG